MRKREYWKKGVHQTVQISKLESIFSQFPSQLESGGHTFLRNSSWGALQYVKVERCICCNLCKNRTRITTRWRRIYLYKCTNYDLQWRCVTEIKRVLIYHHVMFELLVKYLFATEVSSSVMKRTSSTVLVLNHHTKSIRRARRVRLSPRETCQLLRSHQRPDIFSRIQLDIFRYVAPFVLYIKIVDDSIGLMQTNPGL